MGGTGPFATPFFWSATRPYSRASPRCRGAPIRREERVGERWDQHVRGSRALANHPKRVTTRTRTSRLRRVHRRRGRATHRARPRTCTSTDRLTRRPADHVAVLHAQHPPTGLRRGRRHSVRTALTPTVGAT